VNYLQLAQAVYREGGISGNITSTQNQNGEALRVAQWVALAYKEILNDQGMIWNFLHKSARVRLSAGHGIYKFSDFNLVQGVQWDTHSMRVAVNQDMSDETFCVHMRYPEFRDFWQFSSRRQTKGRPLNVAVDTETHLCVAPIPDQDYFMTLQYLIEPDALSQDDDVPVLPNRFHMAIVWRALRHYGMFESAPEVVVRADAALKDIMQQLENDQSPEVIVGAPLC
jgi:hypothetical protein